MAKEPSRKMVESSADGKFGARPVEIRTARDSDVLTRGAQPTTTTQKPPTPPKGESGVTQSSDGRK